MTLFRKPSDLRLAIVLLAAGEGSRMGSIPKALLKKDGISFLEKFCVSVKALHPVKFVAITGFHAQVIEQELTRLSKLLDQSITIVHNPNASAGQASSVRLALESLGGSYDVVAMCLSDQPNIGEAELMHLLAQFGECSSNQKIVMPMVGATRGNPVLFSRESVEEMLALPGMVCRAYMDQHPEKVKILNSDNEAYILDVDTDSDIQKLGITRA